MVQKGGAKENDFLGLHGERPSASGIAASALHPVDGRLVALGADEDRRRRLTGGDQRRALHDVCEDLADGVEVVVRFEEGAVRR